MNLFILSENHEENAKWHCDKHVIKMPTEAYQMIGSALIRHGVKPKEMPLTKSGTPLKGGYPHHPCTRWVGDTRENFKWACLYGLYLCQEYSYRYNKTHFVEHAILKMAAHTNRIPDGELTEFAIAISEDSNCRKYPNFNSLSTIDKYRIYYIMDKYPIAKWSKTEIPSWFNDNYKP